MTFLTNIGNFGYYTIKLTDNLKFIIKPFTHKKKYWKHVYFDRPNTFFWFNGTDYLPLQFKLAEVYCKLLNVEEKLVNTTEFNKFIFEKILEK